MCGNGSASVVEWFSKHLLDPLLALSGAGADDWFNLRIEPLGLGEVKQGQVLILERHFKGIPVVPDELRVFLTYSAGASFRLEDTGADSQTLELRRPEPDEPLCVVSVQSSVQRDLAILLHDSKPSLDENAAVTIAALAGSVVPERSETALLIYRFREVPHLAWRVVLFESGTQQALVMLDAATGEVLVHQGPVGFRVWTPALNPHEAYPSGSARPLKPFPYADVYGNAIEWVSCGGGPHGVWRGATPSYLGSADYHGNVSIQNPPPYLILDHRYQGYSPDLNQVASLGPADLNVQFCHSGEQPEPDFCGWCRAGQWVPCSNPACGNFTNEFYYFTGGWRDPQTRSDFDTPWTPSDSGIQCHPANEAQIRQHVGPSARQGRRKEIYYHSAIAQHFWREWLGVPMGETEVRVPQYMSGTLDHCSGGPPTKAFSDRTIQVHCGLCSYEQQNQSYLHETRTRSGPYHEFGHVADYALHNAFSNHVFLDVPEDSGGLTEAVSALSHYAVGWFESYGAYDAAFYGRPPIDPNPGGDNPLHRAYPTGYDCGCNARCVDGYETRFVWVNPWFDLLFSSGLPLAMKVLRNHIGEMAFNGGFWVIYAYCVNTFDYSGCDAGAYDETYYGRMFQAAISTWSPDYQLTFEVSKSWHDRVSDWDPGLWQCQGPGHRALPYVDEDRDLDFAPWFDDVTNVAWYSPFIPLDTHGNEVYFRGWGYGLRHGPFSESPASCLGRDSAAQCDYLSLDYATDRDKFLLVGRAGVQYFIYAMPGPQATVDMNPFMEIRNASDQIVASNDDCADASMPPIGIRYPCMRFTPPSTSPYRVVIRRGPNSSSGSRAQYKLVVETRGDDYCDVLADASPVPPGFANGRINYSGDADWFYQTMFSSGDIALMVQPGSNPVYIRLQDHTGRVLISQLVSSVAAFSFPDQPRGTYYLRISHATGYGWNHQYSFYWSNTSQVGGNQTTAASIGDPGVPTPLPSIGLTGLIGNAGGTHRYRKSAQTQEPCVVDAQVTTGSVRLWVERDARGNTPVHQRIVPEAPIDNVWETLATDEHGGLAAEGRNKAGAHLTFVAPWQGDYFFAVQAVEVPASYTLWVECGPVWGGLPEFPSGGPP